MEQEHRRTSNCVSSCSKRKSITSSIPLISKSTLKAVNCQVRKDHAQGCMQTYDVPVLAR